LDKEADLWVRNMLAMPDDLVPPGHMTGGAVDVILGDDHGDFIPTQIKGTNIVDLQKQNYTFFKDLPQDILNNRKILYNAMTKVGFNNFFKEY